MHPIHLSVWKIIMTGTRNTMPDWCFALGTSCLLRLVRIDHNLDWEDVVRQHGARPVIDWSRYFHERVTNFPYRILKHALLSNRATENDVFDTLFYSATLPNAPMKEAYRCLYVLPAFVRHLPSFAGSIHRALKSYGTVLSELTQDAIESSWQFERNRGGSGDGSAVVAPWKRVLAYAENLILALNRSPQNVYAGVLNHLVSCVTAPGAPSPRQVHTCSKQRFTASLRNIDTEALQRYADEFCEGMQTVEVLDDTESTSIHMDVSTHISESPNSIEGLIANVQVSKTTFFTNNDTYATLVCALFRYTLSSDYCTEAVLVKDSRTMLKRYVEL